MPVREVVLNRDARAPADLSPRLLRKRYVARRVLSIVTLVTIDLGAMLLAAFVTLPLIESVTGLRSTTPARAQLVAAAAITLFVFLLHDLYGRRFARRSVARILRAAFVALLAIVVAMVAFDLSGTVSRASLTLIWSFAVLFLIVGRSLYDWMLGRLYPQGDLLPILLVGRPAFAEQARELLRRAQPAGHYRIIGFVGDEPAAAGGGTCEGLDCIGVLANLESVVRREQPAEVLIGDPELTRDCMPQLLEICRRQRIVLKLASVDLDFGSAAVSSVPGFGVPLFVLRTPALAGFDFYFKRAADVISATLLTLLLAPLLAAIAVAIKLDTPGPVFFVDTRVGLSQRFFRCYKFRTMRRDAADLQEGLEGLNEAGGAIFKIRDDPRVTRVGRFLRKTSFDELPQLFNVIKCQMSLVGPRPLPLRDFGLLDDLHKQRHIVLPGMTGLWQVSGRSELSFDEMIALDLRYIETWSISSDLIILARTVGAVFGLKGAY